ncbi:protein of unknown function [Micropruina glycogenica]|uniref:Permease n=1 Tax=Micropruina glycogenica TaxID=75385 RepID=A0A2N9JCF1_9ACTN|nr:protein of unknown function [Micropruina glycogenica]
MPDPITMLLVAAGVLTGIVGYGAGLASLVTFPALLAAGHAITDREPDQHGVAGRHQRRVPLHRDGRTPHLKALLRP